MARKNRYDEPARFIVRGRGAFPIDMLRHDHAWPASEIDSGRVIGSTGEQRRVELTASAYRLITPGRWASYGWEVVEIDGEPTGPVL